MGRVAQARHSHEVVRTYAGALRRPRTLDCESLMPGSLVDSRSKRGHQTLENGKTFAEAKVSLPYGIAILLCS